MARIVWNAIGDRFYETGIDRGVLYVPGFSGVPWQGLISVSEKVTGGSPQPYYQDGIKYLNIASSEEFSGTIEAYSAPKEFDLCDGVASLANGLFATQQPRKQFGLSYRTKIGNDISGADHGYKLHLVYNALAQPASRDNQTLDDAAAPVILSWGISTVPVKQYGIRPTAHFVIDSRTTSPEIMTILESFLYGEEGVDPSFPTVNELIDIFTSPPGE